MNMFKIVFMLFISLCSCLFANQPIKPIPLHIKYDHQKAELGKVLYFDPGLSSSGNISCASCHSFEHGGADPRAVSTGVGGKKGDANSPTVYNSYFNFRQFWNGRAKDLSSQANGPMHNPVEMGMNNKAINKYLNHNPYYLKKFEEIYHTKPTTKEAINAIVEFEKALYTPNCKFDKYLRGEVKLSKLEMEGYELFKTLGCITCHNGINIGGNSYQKYGLIYPYKWKKTFADRFAITKIPMDKNVYKVPTLRNIMLTAPYFHDGSAKTIDQALRMMAYHNLGYKNLSKQTIKALKAFLSTLTGEKPSILN